MTSVHSERNPDTETVSSSGTSIKVKLEGDEAEEDSGEADSRTSDRSSDTESYTPDNDSDTEDYTTPDRDTDKGKDYVTPIKSADARREPQWTRHVVRDVERDQEGGPDTGVVVKLEPADDYPDHGIGATRIHREGQSSSSNQTDVCVPQTVLADAENEGSLRIAVSQGRLNSGDYMSDARSACGPVSDSIYEAGWKDSSYMDACVHSLKKEPVEDTETRRKSSFATTSGSFCNNGYRPVKGVSSTDTSESMDEPKVTFLTTKQASQFHAEGKALHACEQCKAVFRWPSHLKNHMLTHTGQKPHSCDQCKAAFTHSGSLKRHMLTHTGQRPFTCEECKATFTRSSFLKSHMLTHTGQRPYTCDQCKATFKQAGHLNRHMLKHKGLRPYTCNLCEATFTESGNLKKHMFKHTGLRPFACDQCDATFTQSSNLKSHMLVHTGQRPYTCDQCTATFSRSSHLNRHMLTHTGQRPYTCQVCEAAFSRSSHLKDHMQKHTGEKPYSCDLCDATFSRSSHLKRHLLQVLKHTGQRPFTSETHSGEPLCNSVEKCVKSEPL